MGRALASRLLFARIFGAISLLILAATDASAQSASCSQLNRSLNALNRNSDFRNLQRSTNQARDLSRQLQRAESQFVRIGCQRLVNARQRLPQECRALGRTILSGREDLRQFNASIETGRAVAQQREATLQQIARFGCNTPRQQQAPQAGSDRFTNFLDRVFGGNGDSNQIVEEPANPYFNQQTLRTVCVRKCDGYYWPVSFSTVPEFLSQDAQQCAQQCPGSDVELYYYQNPGEEADAMVNLDGAAYSRLPNAFRYRKEFDGSCSCKAPISYGQIQLQASADGASSRAVIQFENQAFPLPIRDPRRQATKVAAQATYVPLPRPRPAEVADGAARVQPAALKMGTRGRYSVIQSNGREVRIVGPKTPYVQAAEAGS